MERPADPWAVAGRPPRHVKRAGRRRPGVGALLSALLPGAGQWYAGRLVRGLLFLAPFLAAAAVAGVVLWRSGRGELAALLVRPSWLWAIVAVDLVLAGVRVASVIDAHRLTRPVFGAHRRGEAAVAVLLAIAVAVPHLVVAGYALEGIDLLETVFGERRAPPPAASAGASIGPVAGPAPDLGPEPVIVADDLAVRVPGVSSRPAGPAVWERLPRGDVDAAPDRFAPRETSYFEAPFVPGERIGEDRITVLLAGGDAGPGRGGLRTDTIIVASLDPATGTAVLLGLPRNFARIPLPGHFAEAFLEMEQRLEERAEALEAERMEAERLAAEAAAAGGSTTTTSTTTTTTTTVPGETTTTTTTTPGDEPCLCFPEQINALYPSTRTWTRTFPDEVDPGMKALEMALEVLYGVEIDYYVLVDMAGFVRLIDAIGGVDLQIIDPVRTRVSPPEEGGEWIVVDLQSGPAHLTGSEALAYVRSRYGTSDYSRMRRQRCLLEAVAAEADPLTIVRRFPELSAVLKDSVVTDIPLGLLPGLVEAVGDLGFDDVTTFAFGPGYYAPTYDYFGHPIPSVTRIRAKVADLFAGSAAGALGAESECLP